MQNYFTILCKYGSTKCNKIITGILILFKNGSNINAIFNNIGNEYVKNETLFNMIKQNTNMINKTIIELLIEYKFDFAKLFNMYDNIKQENGLILCASHEYCYDTIKLLIDHCKTQQECNIDIRHFDSLGWNPLFCTVVADIKAFSYLLSNVSFPNGDVNNEQRQIALNLQNHEGQTVAHYAAYIVCKHSVDTSKLLHKHHAKFNIYDFFGRLPIHYACKSNNHLLLSWMIDENIYENDINCKTKFAKNAQKYNDWTPLFCAIEYNSTQCTNILCKQPNIEITTKDIKCALKNDNVTILKLLLCRLFGICKISKWSDIEHQSSNVFNSNASPDGIEKMIVYCEKNITNKCHLFLNDLHKNGYSVENYEYIVFKLDYNIKTIMNQGNINNIKSIDDVKDNQDKYNIIGELGEGGFGVVKLGQNKNTKEKVAIKYINLKKGNKQATPIQFITSEIESLKQMNTNENIIKLIDYTLLLSSNQVILYFEYCERGELYLLLKQCDHLPMKIAFKYFLQLLNAIKHCHKKNIVHRDLKLTNILVSDTFQLKVADFGLAAIVNNENVKTETMYKVGTRGYRAPELLEPGNLDLKVLKACDVFSLSIIFWQMMNGVKYLPFTLSKYWDVRESNYKYIKDGNYDKFWHIHKTCNMFVHDKQEDKQLLRDLFNQMFDYNRYQRITIEKILKHEWIVRKEENALFQMNDARLEVFVRDTYNKIKHSPVKQLTKETKPSSFKSTNIAFTSISVNVSTSSSQSSNSSTDSVNEDALDSSRGKGYVLQNRDLKVSKPIVIMIGIANYKKNINDKDGTLTDYINVKSMLNDVKKYDLMYQNKKRKIVHHKMQSKNRLDDTKENKETGATTQRHIIDIGADIDLNEEFQTEWTINELKKFNQQVFKIIESRENRGGKWKYKYEYDAMIYIVSSHLKHDILTFEHSLYDSNGELYSFNKIFDQFNNGKCGNLRKKAKIFILDGYDPNDRKTETINIKNENKKRMDQALKISQIVNNDDVSDIKFVEHHKRVLYCPYKNNNENMTNYDINKDGHVLISSFCTSLANNEIKEMNINDLIKQTQKRYHAKMQDINNNIYDENYIENRYKVTFMTTK